MTTSNQIQAVLTGDVIGSSGLGAGDRQALPALLKRAGRDLRKAFPKAVPLNLDVFRGDSWQLIVSDPALSIRAGLFFRAYVIASSPSGLRIDTRMAIAVGTIDFVSGRVSEGDGPAYRASGKDLDALPDQVRMSFSGAGGAGEGVMVTLLDAIIQNWTALQARAAMGRLQGWTQAETSKLWPNSISQQTVARHLERAHWPAIEIALRHLEDSLSKL